MIEMNNHFILWTEYCVHRHSLQFTDISMSVQISVMRVLQIWSKHAVFVLRALHICSDICYIVRLLLV
jgi:hypothetical protein